LVLLNAFAAVSTFEFFKAKTTQQIKLAGKNMAAQITPCTKKSKETFRRCINGDIWNNLCSK